jgi:hypothetical protein
LLFETYKNLEGNSDGKRRVGEFRSSYEDNAEMDLKEGGVVVGLIHLLRIGPGPTTF